MTIRVLGLGNVLMSDDGFGPFVVEYLQALYDVPPGVEVLDVGTPGLDLLPYVCDTTALIVVDTVRDTAPAGALRRYGRTAILARGSPARLSPHDPGLKEALLTAELAGRGPRDVLLIGAVPSRVRPGPRLTPPLRAAVAAASRLVAEELARLGAPPRPRAGGREPTPWWTVEPEGAYAS